MAPVLGGVDDLGVDPRRQRQAVGAADARAPEYVDGLGHGGGVVLGVGGQGEGGVGGALGDPLDLPRRVAVEDGRVLGQGDAAARLFEAGELEVGRRRARRRRSRRARR